MRKHLSLYPIFGILSMFLLFSCAPKVSVVSCTSQQHYPGRQEEKPFQEIKVELNAMEESIQIDSLRYGNQTLILKGKETTYRAKAEGTMFSESATLYFSKNKKQHSVQVDSISKLQPLYLP